MTKTILYMAVLYSFTALATNCYATLSTPTLSYSISGLNVSITWTAVPKSTRYTLYYAPYPYTGQETIRNIDMGSNTSFSIDLWDGAAYYIALTASTDTEESEYSNIQLLKVSTDNTPAIRHKNVSVSVFWIGEEGNNDNGNIPNITSAWDDMWIQNYGGVDTPERRTGYHPSAFVPAENPFYCALPYNNFAEDGTLKTEVLCPDSSCKNSWLKITKDNRVAYAQWEDVGPFGENDANYVFGSSPPANLVNNNAGLDVSPAVRDYLALEDLDIVDWEFVASSSVPDGPWKEIITTSPVNWVEWYKPEVNTSWQIQLQGDVSTSYAATIYDIDLFDSSESLIESLKNSGKKVICYFSAGSFEDWREDRERFPDEALGNNLDGWPGEKWLDIRNKNLKSIMLSRLDLAVQKGCDGVDPDNMDGYTNDTGFNIDAAEQLTYNKFIANEAHKRGLTVGLKNDIDQIAELEPFFDFSVNEQCHIYNECESMLPFIVANKPVLNLEYATKYIKNTDGEQISMCTHSSQLQFKTLIMPLALDDSFRYNCEDLIDYPKPLTD